MWTITDHREAINSVAGWFFRNTYILALLEGISLSIFGHASERCFLIAATIHLADSALTPFVDKCGWRDGYITLIYSTLAVGDKNVWWYSIVMLKTTSNLVSMHIHIWALIRAFGQDSTRASLSCLWLVTSTYMQVRAIYSWHACNHVDYIHSMGEE